MQGLYRGLEVVSNVARIDSPYFRKKVAPTTIVKIHDLHFLFMEEAIAKNEVSINHPKGLRPRGTCGKYPGTSQIILIMICLTGNVIIQVCHQEDTTAVSRRNTGRSKYFIDV